MRAPLARTIQHELQQRNLLGVLSTHPRQRLQVLHHHDVHLTLRLMQDQRGLFVKREREQEVAVLEAPQVRQYLARGFTQWHLMSDLALKSLSRHRPYLALEVEFAPAGTGHLGLAGTCQCEQLEQMPPRVPQASGSLPEGAQLVVIKHPLA